MYGWESEKSVLWSEDTRDAAADFAHCPLRFSLVENISPSFQPLGPSGLILIPFYANGLVDF